MNKKRLIHSLFICLILIFLGGLGSYLVQTNMGKIQVTSVNLPSKYGEYVTGDLYRPKSATVKNKAPMVIIVPGFQRTKETQISNSLELARRGIVTLVVDPYSQGEASSKSELEKESSLIPAIEYVTKTSIFDYVDKDRIGITGHSAGGSSTLKAAAKYGKAEKEATKAATDPKSDGGEKITKAEAENIKKANPISAAFISGWLQNLKPKSFENIHSNLALGYAFYDEGGYRNKNKNGDLRTAPEAIDFVNSGLSKSEKVDHVEIEKAYGKKEDKTLRIAYNEHTLHPIQPFVPKSVAGIIEFFTDTLDVKTDLSSLNQTWFLKELFNLVSLIGAFLMLLPLAKMLLTTKFFSELKKEVPEKLPKQNKKGKIIFWITFILNAVFACLTFIPLAKQTGRFFYKATNSINTYFFPARMVNAVLLWAIVNGLLGFIIFFGTYHLYSKKHGVTSDMWGFKVTVKELWKTFLLAISIVSIFYFLLAIISGLFHSDYRFLVVAARPLSRRWFLVALEYIPLFFIFYLSNSLRVNGSMRFTGQKEWVSNLIIALANSVGLAAIFVIQYGVFAKTGTVYYKDEWLYVNMLQSVLPMMFILPLFNRAFFKISGKVWLGAMVTCILFIIMSLGGSVIYIPTP